MPGMRSEAEVLKAFEGLDRIPGSKQKRRESTEAANKKRAQAFGESNGWDAKPIVRTLNGKEIELFQISALAAALETTIQSVRLWERRGYIPIAPYRLKSKSLNGKKVNGNRVYSRELIDIAIEEFARRGLLGAPRVEWKHHKELTAVLVARWKESVGN